MDNYPPALRVLVRLLLVFLVIAVLEITRNLLVPLFLAVLFAYLLFPAAQRMESWGVPRIATNFILIISSLAVVVISVLLIADLTTSFMEDLPEIRERLKQNITYFQYVLGDFIGVSEGRQDAIINNMSNSGQYLSQFFTATANSILAIGLIPVYTFLLLLYRNKFREFISRLVSHDQEETVQSIIDQASEVVPQYMKGLFLVCFILIGLNSLGFFLVGVQYALLLGVIAALFNLIPYLGTVIGYGLVFLFVLATQSPALSLAVIIQFFIVQFLENNILTPNITGSYVQINPLVTIFFLIGGGIIWGLPGMFMVIPYLAMLKIVCENNETLKPIGFLLGTRGTERHSITFENIKKKLKLKD